MGKHPVQTAGRSNGRASALLPCAGADKRQCRPKETFLKGCMHTASRLAKGLRAFARPSPRTNPEEVQQSQGCTHIPPQEQTLGTCASGKEFSQQLLMSVHTENQLW